jgi:protease-4
MRIALSVLAALCLTAAATHAASWHYPAPRLPIFARSTASVNGVDCVWTNPAALKANPELELGMYHSFNDSTLNGDYGIGLSKSGLGVGYQSIRLDGRPAINSWTIGLSSHHNNMLYIGSSYTFFKSNREGFHNHHFWKAGMAYRPRRQLSISVLTGNINRMRFDGRRTAVEYTLGGAIRPSGERLTLSGDFVFYGGERFMDGILTGFADVQLRNGIDLHGHVDETGAFGVGLSVSFGRSTFSSQADFDEASKFDRGLVAYSYNQSPRGHALSKPGRFIMMRLSGQYPEEKQASILWRKPNCTFAELVLDLEKARLDASVKGIALYIDQPGLGMAQAEELRGILLSMRSSGKRVIAHLAPQSGVRSYYLASAADRISMQRFDDLALVGLLAEVTFYKGTLDKIGLEAEIERIGDYKSAPEVYTGDSMSVYFREAVEALLDDRWSEIVSSISDNRRLTSDSVQHLVDNAPLISTVALKAGLVDTLLYADQLDEYFKSEMGGIRSERFEEYAEQSPYDLRWGRRDRIAVIPAEGGIAYGSSSRSILDGKTLGSATLNDVIRRTRNDHSVKAVVLRINSPGGEVLGSEAMWRELKLTQEKKPVIVSMSNVAASGGYHIASASDYILAMNSTITGSIGVYYGKLNMSALREKIGLSTTVIKRGQNADMFSMKTGYSESQKRKIRELIELVYDEFVNTVAANRNLTYDEVAKVGAGRVWSGKRAVNNGLVDRIGGLNEAVAVACEKAGVNLPDVDVDVKATRPASLFPYDEITPLAMMSEFAEVFSDWFTESGSIDRESTERTSLYFMIPYSISFR